MLDFDVFIECVTDRPTNRPTDQPTDQPTDTAYYRDARTHLKRVSDRDLKLEWRRNKNFPLNFKFLCVLVF